MDKALIDYLGGLVSENRRTLIEKNLQNRTRYMTIVLEDIFQPHNASAVLRSCDCFGVQDVHIIENSNEYEVNPDVALGASKWLNMYQYNQRQDNSLHTIHTLKQQGYRIVATTPHINDVTLEEFDVHKGKFALAFGTELTGLSDTFLEASDEFLRIPMYGFTESFNISVSAAITMHYLNHKMRKEEVAWQLDEQEQLMLRQEWYTASIKRSEVIIRDYYNQQRNEQ